MVRSAIHPMIWVLGFTPWRVWWIVLHFFDVVARLEVAPAFDAGTPEWPLGKASSKLDAKQECPMRILIVAYPQLRFRTMPIAVAARTRATTTDFAGDTGLNQFLA